MKRSLKALLACLLFAASAQAATVSDRSLFTQGHWWNPERAGSGLEIFHAGGQVMLIWYTYSNASAPIWYTAQGSATGIGREEWPLMKHQWLDGRKAAPTQVGTARIAVDNPESITFDFTVPGGAGRWKLQPFLMAGATTGVDHSGSYYDPANSGWGITVTEQGDTLGGVLYTYEPTGEPRWFAGFGRGSREVEMRVYRGPCPTCPYAASTSEVAGRFTFDFAAEASLTLRGSLSRPVAEGARIDGVPLGQLGRPVSTREADRNLVPFSSTAQLRAYMEAGAANQFFYSSGTVDFSAAPPSSAPPATSSTNLIESGVDEMDLVKTDGRRLYTFDEGEYGAWIPRVRVAEIENGGTVRTVGLIDLPAVGPYAQGRGGFVLTDNRLAVISGPQAMAGRGLSYSYYGSSSSIAPYSTVEIYDTAGTGLPTHLWRMEVSGSVAAVRRIGQRLFVLTRFAPLIPGYWWTPVAERAALLARQPLEVLLPRKRVRWDDVTLAVDASKVYLPPQGPQQPLSDMLVVTEIDLAGPRHVDTIAIAGPLEGFYASPSNLYVATSRQPLRQAGTGRNLPVEPPYYVTDIHKITLAGGRMAVEGSGSVEGFFGVDIDKGGFRMSEHDGRLRVVTSSRTGWWGADNFNRLTVLEPAPAPAKALRTVAYLPNPQRPERLGKPNELLYGVRFVGDRLYAVTFKKTDPLYVVNLAKPHDPFIAGALEIPGYSDYLHPLGNGLLLGFGMDAVPATSSGDAQFAWFQGLHVTLFDVSDEDRPRELKRLLLGKRGSTSALLQSHHAFSSLRAADGSLMIGIPMRLHDGTPLYGSGGPTAWYPHQQSGLMRFRLVGSTPATAELVEDAPLITHRNDGAGNWLDPAAYNGRGILMQDGALLVGNGKVWRLDRAGVTTGPL